MFSTLTRFGLIAPLLALAACAATNPAGSKDAGMMSDMTDSGVIRVRSGYQMSETIERVKRDVAAKGIMFFSAIDQSALAAGAGIALPPSTLLTFGNPPLGIQFITANPDSGLDWPVRLLVRQDSGGQVWMEYTDFAWIARRHHITDRDAQFAMASKVIASITSAAK